MESWIIVMSIVISFFFIIFVVSIALEVLVLNKKKKPQNKIKS